VCRKRRRRWQARAHIRENTERPEAIEAGVAASLGGSSALALMLEEAYE